MEGKKFAKRRSQEKQIKKKISRVVARSRRKHN